MLEPPSEPHPAVPPAPTSVSPPSPEQLQNQSQLHAVLETHRLARLGERRALVAVATAAHNANSADSAAASRAEAVTSNLFQMATNIPTSPSRERTAFGVQFSPFVFETHGGLGEKAMEFVDKLSLHAAARPGASSRGNFRFHLLSSLSVIIQRANAQLVAHHYVQSYAASRYHPGRVLQVGGIWGLIVSRSYLILFMFLSGCHAFLACSRLQLRAILCDV